MRNNSALIAAVLMVVAFTAAPARAGKIRKMDEKNIAAFIEETTRITSGEGLAASPEAAAAYMEDHLAPDGNYESLMRLDVPGYPPQETGMRLDKAQYIESLLSGAQAVGGHKSEIEILDMEISNNGERAHVRTVSRESGLMPLRREDGTVEEIPVEGESRCDQTLTLSEDGIIQMQAARCETSIRFAPEPEEDP